MGKWFHAADPDKKLAQARADYAAKNYRKTLHYTPARRDKKARRGADGLWHCRAKANFTCGSKDRYDIWKNNSAADTCKRFHISIRAGGSGGGRHRFSDASAKVTKEKRETWTIARPADYPKT
jgi:hypothetical protein